MVLLKDTLQLLDRWDGIEIGVIIVRFCMISNKIWIDLAGTGSITIHWYRFSFMIDEFLFLFFDEGL